MLTESCINSGIGHLLDLTKTKILLLENLRFHPEETQNDMEFARALSQYGELYINDAFGCCHRKHASVYGINAFYKNRNFGGLLLRQEVKSLAKVVGRPKTLLWP